MVASASCARPERVGVAIKPSSPEAAELGRRLLEELQARGVDGVVDRESSAALGVVGGPARSDLGQAVDLVFVLGGDGTFLSVARGCPTGTPIAGINLGSLGFLTEHSAERALDLLDDVVAGRARVETRDRLAVRIDGDESPRDAMVLNDVVVTNATLARILTVYVEADGEFLSRYRADGLIVSSPTGSTAYNLSAGGPIVHPGMKALIITPICAHTLTNRPLVVPMEVRLRVWSDRSYENVLVTLDGQVGFPLPPGASLVVEKSPHPLSIVPEPGGGFFGILHRKLKWGERGE